MEPGDVIKDYINLLSKSECIYINRVIDLLSAEIKPSDLNDLATLINLYEMHEEALKETRRALMLKQQACLMGYMAAYAKSFNLAM